MPAALLSRTRPQGLKIVPAHLTVPALRISSRSGFVHVIGCPVGKVPSLPVFVSGAHPPFQFGTWKKRTFAECGVKSRFVPPILICGERSVIVPLRPESLVVISSLAQ